MYSVCVQEGRKEGGREGGREGGKEGGREGNRKGVRGRGREGERERKERVLSHYVCTSNYSLSKKYTCMNVRTYPFVSSGMFGYGTNR